MSDSFYEPLKYSAFRIIWIATLFANFGTWMHSLTSSVLIASLSHSSIIISCLQAATMLPVFLFSIPAGIIATHVNKTKLLLYARIFMSIVAFATAILSFLHFLNQWNLILLTFLLNTGWAFNQPAWQAFSPNLVPKNLVKKAASINNFSYNITRAFGPAVGGIIFAHIGPAWVFLLNAFSFFAPIIIFYQWKEKSSTNFSPNSSELKTYSILEILKLSLFKNILIKSSLFFMFSTAVWVVLPYLVVVKFHMNSTKLGLLTSCIGIGAILNVFLIEKLRNYFIESNLINISKILSAISLALLAFTQNFNLMAVILILFGFSWASSVSIFNGILQYSFDNSNRSRAIGIYCVVFALNQVLGSFITGIFIEKFEYKITLICFSAILTISIFFSKFYKIEDKIILKNESFI